MKRDLAVFRRLLVAAEGGRKINPENILQFELTYYPCSLANTNGALRSGNKAVLSAILEGKNYHNQPPPLGINVKPQCRIINGMILLQSIGKPVGSKTFGDLVDIFVICVLNILNSACSRIDVFIRPLQLMFY